MDKSYWVEPDDKHWCPKRIVARDAEAAADKYSDEYAFLGELVVRNEDTKLGIKFFVGSRGTRVVQWGVP